MKSKAQSAIEFIIIIGAVLFFAIMFFMAIQKNIEQKNIEKETIIVQSIVLSIQDELNLAKKASNGYSREFNVETTISGYDYEISIIDNRIYAKTERVAMSYPVVNINGSIKKGINIIKKQNGEIYLN